MKRCVTIMAAVAGVVLSSGRAAVAHCQIPCGIYGDETRFTLMVEHVTTIEKSMKQIESLGKADKPDWNQLVRWVDNKEAHADKLSDIITSYFMAQRVKPAAKENADDYDRYVRQLAALHRMLVYAMKSKQSTDLNHCVELRKLIAEFRKLYTKS